MKFNVNGLNWEIKELSQKEIKEFNNSRKGEGEKDDVSSISERYYGITYHDILKIYIDKDLPEERKIKTLIHELTHVYISTYITHQDIKYCEEDVCDINANSHDFINKIVNKYFKI